MSKLKFLLLYPFVWLLKKSKNLSATSCRLVQLTGKSKYSIHPKHLVKIEEPWYLREIKEDDVVLDLGCGNGQHSLKTASKAKKVIGVDYNSLQLEIAKKQAKDKKIKNASFLKYNLEKKLPFDNYSFDKILCLDVLEHLNKRKQFLLEIKRVLKSKGIAFIAVPNKNTSWKKLQKKVGLNFYSDPDHKIEYSLSEIKKLLALSGFEMLSIQPIVYDTCWAGFIDLIGGFSLGLYKRLSLWKKNKLKNNPYQSIGFRIKVRNFI